MIISIIIGIFSSFLQALSNVFYKRWIDLANERSVDAKYLSFFATGAVVVLATPVLFLVPSFREATMSITSQAFYTAIKLVLLTAWLGICSTFLAQYALKNEKLSVLLPYNELSPLVTILVGVIYFHEYLHPAALIFIILASVTLIINGVDFKELHFSRSVLAMILSQLIKVAMVWVATKILKLLPAFTYLVIDATIAMFIAAVIAIRPISFREQFSLCRGKFVQYALTNTFAFITYYAIVLFLYSKLWIALTTTLGMTSLIFALIIGYILNRDRPDKKSLVVSGMVMIAIAANVFFK